MRQALPQIILLLVVAAAAGPAAAQTELDEQVDAAIKAGVAQIWSTQLPHGGFSDPDARPPGRGRVYPGDRDVMAMVVLAYAGEDPATNPRMKKALKVLLEIDLDQNYTLGFRIITLTELYRRTEDQHLKTGLRAAIRHDVALLLEIQRQDNGAWSYDKRSTAWGWDFSNTQIAVLALREAVDVGIEVPLEAFRRVQQLYLKEQQGDGGWNYGSGGATPWNTSPPYGSMTAAATASLFITRDALDPGQGCPCRGGQSRGRRDKAVQEAINGGVAWLGRHFTLNENPCGGQRRPYYWLYAAERVGMHTGLKYFGTHDWYREGAKRILETGRNNAWGSFDRTSFALLFLIKGHGPILMNKVMYDGPWDLHPYDVARLADYVTEIKEQRFNWQVIHLDIPVPEMHDAPILYITAEQAIAFSDQHKKKLREFTDTGGSLLLEASCGNRGADTFWRALCHEIWPESELTQLGKEHPLWTADLEMGDKDLPLLYGLSDGLRTFLFYSPRDISCQWHTQAVAHGVNLFRMGNNLYAYTTDRARIRSRFVGQRAGSGKKYAGQDLACGPRSALKVARLAQGNGWHLTRRYRPWQLLADELKESAKLNLTEGEPVSGAEAIPATTDLLHMSGQGQLDLPDATIAHLKTYLTKGGFLFVEAVAGDPLYDRSFRQSAGRMGLELKECDGGSPVLSGQVGSGGRGFRIGNVTFTHALRERQLDRATPSLVELRLGERLVGIYSPLDIMFSQTGCRAFGNRGYAPDDARALAINIALLAAGRDAVAHEGDKP